MSLHYQCDVFSQENSNNLHQKKMPAVAKFLQIKTQITLQFQNIFNFLAIV